MDRRFRLGHPWVYSNELLDSPKGIEPGECVELQDASGRFLARGFGNPSSLIAFRSLTRNPDHLEPTSKKSILEALRRAKVLRFQLGFEGFSYRLFYGEADGLAGLVIDRFATLAGGQVLVIQAHSAGADGILESLPGILEAWTKETYGNPIWDQTSILFRNDLSIRKLEGLAEETPEVIQSALHEDLKSTKILIRPVSGQKPLVFRVNLWEGQKTGFFLDQYSNIQLASLRFEGLVGNSIRILDLCSYVGQWGAQLSSVFQAQGRRVEVLAVDSSPQALEFAKQNVEAQGAHCHTLKANVLKDLGALETGSFDLVICDPPAFIKNRKDIPTGTHAYLQLATKAMRWVRPQGGLVFCSCSALLTEEALLQVLSKASQRNVKPIRWVGRGSQSPDHPLLTEFPEGRYLKAWIGIA